MEPSGTNLNFLQKFVNVFILDGGLEHWDVKIKKNIHLPSLNGSEGGVMMDPGPGYQALMWSKWYICDSGDRKSRLMTLTNIE